MSNPYSLSSTTLIHLTHLIQTHQCRTIIECGSGQSTLHLAQLQAQGIIDRYLSLEHDLYWYHHTRTLLQTHNLPLDSLHHTPLTTDNHPWYDISQIPPIPADLILIDGPPGNSHPLARYPAPDRLQSFLRPSTLLLLDDSQRPDEQTILKLWQQEHALEHLETIQLDKSQLTLLHLTETSPIIPPRPAAPKVSLITTIYNREAYLPETIESILTQTHPNLELILWDDGSTDDSLEICHHYAAQDDRIRVIAAEHQGRGPAIAQASALATGKYIGVVDSDDLLAETALAETVNYLETHPHIGMVYTDYIIIDETGAMKTYGQHCQIPYDYDRLLTEFIIFHFRLMHTSIYHQIGGFDPTFMYCQDYDLCLRLAEVTPIAQLNIPLYQYRHHTQSISCEKRIDQIFYGKQAIENALHRRGMADDHELEFQVFARCALIKKHSSKIPAAPIAKAAAKSFDWDEAQVPAALK